MFSDMFWSYFFAPATQYAPVRVIIINTDLKLPYG